MATFVIEGQHRLVGEVTVSGMKNAATPILAATLLTSEACEISNIPRIVDVFNMIRLLESMGAKVHWKGEHTVVISCASVDPGRLNQGTVEKLRSSVLLLGPLVARFPELRLRRPGGCIIGNRPLDAHLEALQALGTTIEESDDGVLTLRRSQLKPTTIVLSEFSVTATENAMMAAALLPGTTTIHIAAAEPHIQDLAVFLKALGVTITGAGTHTLVVQGSEVLHGASHRVIPDQIEVGTWAVAAAVTDGDLTIHDVEADHLDLILLKLRHSGVACTLQERTLRVRGAKHYKPFRLQALPYPGFPSDLQAPFGVLATQARGLSLIHDPLYEGRMGYAQELNKMGANTLVCDPHRLAITGPTPLRASNIKTLDLRAGATFILAALVAQGTSTIQNAELVDRGYEAIDEKLRSIGAKIERQT